jgi:hypothetical protein
MPQPSENFPLCVFDSEAELSDEEFSALLFMLIHDCQMSLEEFRAYMNTSGRVD